MKLKRLGAILLAGIVALSLGACGSSSNSYAKQEYASGSSAAPAADDYAAYDGGYTAESMEEAKAVEESADADIAPAGAKEASTTVEEPMEPKAEEPEIDPAKSEQKLIYTCDVRLETLAYQNTMDSIRALIKQYKGIIQNESTSDNDNYWYYSDRDHSGTMSTYMTVRIPTKDYSSFLKGLEGTGSRIRSQNQYVQNITRAYNDQTVLVEALQTQEKRLLTMMDKAQTIEEMIAVENRLTEVQTQLNQAKRALASMDTDVAYSTINLTIDEVKDYTPNTKKETFGERVIRGITESWSGFVKFLQDAVVAIIYLFPFLILLGIIAAVIIILVRRGNRRRAARLAARRAAMGANSPVSAPVREKKKLFGRKKQAEPVQPAAPDKPPYPNAAQPDNKADGPENPNP